MFGGVSLPTGYLFCDGASVLRASYPNLFAAIGTAWGSVDGTHFNVPDLRGRAGIGAGQGVGLTNRVLGASGGAETHALTPLEGPPHSHTIGLRASQGSAINTTARAGDAGLSTGDMNTGSEGASAPHNNMQPFAVVNFIIKT